MEKKLREVMERMKKMKRKMQSIEERFEKKGKEWEVKEKI